MRPEGWREAYHMERTVAARQGISRYPCGCQRCHGFKIQSTRTIERHHRRHGRDRHLVEPLLRNPRNHAECEDNGPGAQASMQTHRAAENGHVLEEEEFLDAEEFNEFEPVAANTNVDFTKLAGNCFARVDDIHGRNSEDEDSVLHFDDLSSEEEEPDGTPILEEVLRQSALPLFPGSQTSRLQFSIILMSLCTLFGVSHHCLDEILTFLKHNVLPIGNECPKNSYEMKTMLGKLGLSHEAIHCCDCGKTLYWKENASLSECPKCGKSRYIQGSRSVPLRVFRYFSLIKRLRRMFRSPEIAKHMRWHSTNHSQDNKMRSVVDSEQWKFIDDKYPRFSCSARNVRMGLSLDGVNPHGFQSSKYSVWPVMMVFYNLPPYLVTKRFFICLTMIIPGPNSPSEETIDVFLQPLVLELKKLWKGVAAVDMSEPPGHNRNFKLRGMLMWAIHDFPAYTLLSGQVGKGYIGCPICGESTFAEHSTEAHKTVYLGHRRWLRRNHRWRSARAAFNGEVNYDPPPPRQCGLTMVQHGGWREAFLQCGGRPNSKDDPVKMTGVKRISILFELPYWQSLPIRHTLDPMHCEKNICENLLKTFFGETDGVQSREDMRIRQIRPHLHLQPNVDGVTYFMPDAPYVLTREQREAFLSTLRELKFPSNYVGNLSKRIQDGKLRGLKTHDFHILMEQVLPLCLRNVGNPKVVGAIMRLSRLFRKICAKVIDVLEKEQVLEDVAETICSLEKELPPSIFVIMMHLPIHLVEEMFICGPVHTRWMYPFERYMKGLKGFVTNKAKAEGSMAAAYLREESIGFVNEYLSTYTPTTKRAWDDKEEPAMYDEILEGVKKDRPMSTEFQKLIHGFVLDNTTHMEPYRRRYEDCVTIREQERNEYRRLQRRGGRRTRFMYPRELRQLPEFLEWIVDEVRREQQAGIAVHPEVVDTSRGPLPMATAYKGMYAFGNHYRVLSAERSLKTADSGVAATFKQVCRNGIRDANQVNADVEYVGHIEEILELNYRRHCLVVLVCDFVKANYAGDNATIKKDKWGFTLVNYGRRYGSVTRDSFAFPIHCEQVFYSEAVKAPGWRVLLRKEVRGKRVLPTQEEEVEPRLFQMGRDADFEGLCPEREIGEDVQLPARTGQDVLLEPVGRRQRRKATIAEGQGRDRGWARARRGGCGDQQIHRRRAMNEHSQQSIDEQDELVEEEMLYRNNVGSPRTGEQRHNATSPGRHPRRVRQRIHVQEDAVQDEEDTLDHGGSSMSPLSTSSHATTSEEGEDSQDDEGDRSYEGQPSVST